MRSKKYVYKFRDINHSFSFPLFYLLDMQPEGWTEEDSDLFRNRCYDSFNFVRDEEDWYVRISRIRNNFRKEFKLNKRPEPLLIANMFHEFKE